jgi:hypothetical protein
MFYLIITTFISSFLTEGLEDTCVAIMTFNLGYLIILIFSMYSSKKDKKGKNKILPVGHFSQKHHKLQMLSLVLGFILALILISVLLYVFEMNFISSMIIAFVIVYCFNLILNISTNPLVKILNKFNKEINYSNYEKSILELINGENLHEDSRNYLMLLYVNYMYLYDLDSAVDYFNSIKVPQNKKFSLIYNMVDVINSVNKSDKEEAINKLGLFKQQYQNNKNVLNIERTITVYFTLDEIANIKELYPIDKGLNIQKVINAHLLMIYYKLRNNDLEAKYYAQYVIDHGNDLKQIVEEAKSIIEAELEI